MTSERDIERKLDRWFADRRWLPIASSMRSRTESDVSHSSPRGASPGGTRT